MHRFVSLLTSQKLKIMKMSKAMLFVALFFTGLFVSCTPENIETDEQQIDVTTIVVPRQG